MEILTYEYEYDPLAHTFLTRTLPLSESTVSNKNVNSELTSGFLIFHSSVYVNPLDSLNVTQFVPDIGEMKHRFVVLLHYASL